MKILLKKLEATVFRFNLESFSSLTTSALEGRVMDVSPKLRRLKREHKKFDGVVKKATLIKDKLVESRHLSSYIKKFDKYQDSQRTLAMAMLEAHAELTMMLSFSNSLEAIAVDGEYSLSVNCLKPFSHLVRESSFSNTDKTLLMAFNSFRNIVAHSNIYTVFSALDQSVYGELEVLMNELSDIMFRFKDDNKDTLSELNMKLLK